MALCFVCLNSCKVRPSERSAKRGHYEDADAASWSSVKQGDLRIPPEHEPTEAVMISEILLACYDGVSLAEAILAAESDLWVLPFDRSKVPWCNSGEKPRDTAPILRALQERGKVRILKAKSNTIWARDWGPLIAITNAKTQSESPQRVLIDANYRFSSDSANAHPALQPSDDDLVPSRLEKELHWQRYSLPLYHENGNIMCSSRLCMVTSHLFQSNSSLPKYDGSRKLLHSQDQSHSVSDILTMISRITSASQKVAVVGPLATEGTGHIDMMAKFLDDRTLLINTWPKGNDYYFHIFRMPSHALEKGQLVQDENKKAFNDYINHSIGEIRRSLQSLEVFASSLVADGLIDRVVKVPLPVPLLSAYLFPSKHLTDFDKSKDIVAIPNKQLEQLVTQVNADNKKFATGHPPIPRLFVGGQIIDLEEAVYFPIFRSYTNLLLVNGVAIVPRYRSPDLTKLRGQRLLGYNAEESFLINRYPDTDHLDRYEQAVENALGPYVKSIVWIDSDQWIVEGGAVHCVTMQVPR